MCQRSCILVKTGHGKLEDLELDRRSRLLLILYNLPEDTEDPLTCVWPRMKEKHRHGMYIDEMPQSWEGPHQVTQEQG